MQLRLYVFFIFLWFVFFYIVILQYTNTEMGTTKTAQFTIQQNELAEIAKALGHPARIAIIEYLIKVDACICGDIVNELPLSQPTISQHLAVLKNAALIKGTIEGNAICYCIDPIGFDKIKSLFQNIDTYLDTKNNNCC